MRFVLALLALLVASGSQAQEQISMTVGQTRALALKDRAATIIVASEGIVRAEPGPSESTIHLIGEHKGTTTLTVQNAEGRVFLSAIITVGSPERIIQIHSKTKDVQIRKDFSVPRLDVHDEYTYRCNDSRCQRFTPKNRPMDEDDPHLIPNRD